MIKNIKLTVAIMITIKELSAYSFISLSCNEIKDAIEKIRHSNPLKGRDLIIARKFIFAAPYDY